MFTELDKRAVFFIRFKPPVTLFLDSKRKQADDRVRDHFRDFRHSLVTPCLPGISAFGTRMAFYEYVVANNRVTPRAITPDPDFLNDVAPVEQWNCDLLEDEGNNRMRQVVQDVKGYVSGFGQLNVTTFPLSPSISVSLSMPSKVGESWYMADLLALSTSL